MLKPIFSGNNDYDKSAFLNWRIEKGNDILNLLNMAKGHLIGSIQIAKAALADNSKKVADITVFPMLANANHGIELYLKALTWMLNILSGKENRIEGKHNIMQIYQNVRSKIKAYGGAISPEQFDNEMASLKIYLDELVSLIKPTPQKDKMDFSRYPLDDKYNVHFFVEELGNVEVDLENFVTRFVDIQERLENMTDFIFDQELNQEW